MMKQRFQQLRIWQEAHALTREVYRVTSGFPKEERYALAAQLRRAALSVSANIADGAGRRTKDDFARFLAMARGSAHECQSHLLVVRDLGYADVSVTEKCIDRDEGLSAGIQKMQDISRSPS